MKRLCWFALSAWFVFASAAAQNFPTRPVTLIVPFPPGGLTDAVARAVVEGMSGPLGQPVVVENIGGASGTIGSGRVARAAPDGYTLLLGIWNTHVANSALLKLDYDLVKDFAPIAFMTDAPLLLAVHKSMPVSNLPELVSWLKTNPDKASSGSAGIGSPPHLLDELMRKQTQTKFQTVHYRGAGPIMQDLMGAQIQLSFINPASATPHVRSGAIKALGVTSAKRMKTLPEVPTMAEVGFAGGMEFSLWSAMFAPRDTPRPIIDTVNRAVVAALADAKVRERLESQGMEIASRDKQTPEALAAIQLAEIKKWHPVFAEAGIKAQ